MPARPSIPSGLQAVLIAALGAIAPACLGDAAVYLTTDLSIVRAELVGIADDTMTVLDENDRATRLPLDRIESVGLDVASVATLPRQQAPQEPLLLDDLGIPDENFGGLPDDVLTGIDDEDVDDADAPVFVDLVDGQRLLLAIEPGTNPDLIAGDAAGYGRVSIPIERVVRIARPGAPTEPEPTESDLVLLTNGDALSGFVASIGHDVTIETDVGGSTTVPLSRIAEIRLANPIEPTTGVFVADATGTVVRAHAFGVDADGILRITAQAAPLGIESNGEPLATDSRPGLRFASLRIHRPDQQVVALDASPPTDVQPTGDRRWTPAPESLPRASRPAMLGDVLLPAPATVRYDVPRGAARFATGVSHSGGPWTDCNAVAHAEQRDGSFVLLGLVGIRADSPHGSIAADLPKGTIAIVLSVEPGRYGAIQDSVVFMKPRLLIRD